MNRRVQPVPVRAGLPEAEVATRLPQGATGGGGEEAAAAYAAFSRIGAQLSAFADQQAQTEGALAGAAEGAREGYRPTNAATLRGRAYDAAGNAAFLAQTQAAFASDAMDLHQRHRDDPVAFKTAYDGLTESYRARVAATGPQLVGDFTTRATSLGAQLRLKVADAFETRQQEQARARLYESQQAHQTTVRRLALGDPEGPATMEQAQASLAALDAQVDAMVAARQLTPEEAARRKRSARADTLLTIYDERARRMTDPDEVETLRQRVRADFQAGRMPMLDGETFGRLESGLQQLGAAKRTQHTAATAELRKALDDHVDRAARALSAPAGEWEALEAKARGLGATGAAMLAEARGKLQVERTMRALPAAERAAYVARLEEEARRGGGEASDAGRRIAAKFVQRGFSPTAAAALAGHALAESTGRTDRVNPGDGRDGSDSVGLFQWNGDRGRALRAFAAARGKAWTDEDTQIDFAAQELLAGPEKARGEALAAAGDIRAASRAVMSYLRPAGWSESNPEAGHNWEGRTAAARRLAAGGVTAPMARVVEQAREADRRISRLEKDDPLAAAEQAGVMPGGVAAPLDLADPARLAAGIAARVPQAEAIGAHYQRAPRYFRPEESQRLGELMQAGGAKALAVVDAVTQGAGAAAPQALAEIGEGAPELAHASVVALQTGDRRLQRYVAAALEARRLPGAPALPAAGDDVETALRGFGGALAGADPTQLQRLRQTVALAFGHVALQRGVAPKTNDAKDIAAELAQMALGRTRRDGVDYGGIAEHISAIGWTGRMKFQTVAPPDVKTRRFTDLLHALTDADLAALPDPPMIAGKPATARQLIGHQPYAGGGGYRFGAADEAGDVAYVRAKSGAPFFLDWRAIAPALRARVPDAFR